MTTLSGGLEPTIRRVLDLVEEEGRIRTSARLAELYNAPYHQAEARRLFRRASAARRLRLALLRRCQLL